MTEFYTHTSNGSYYLRFYTDDPDKFEAMQIVAQACMSEDYKKITYTKTEDKKEKENETENLD